MQDLSLVHGLRATRDLVRRHDGEVWRRLERRLDGLLDELHGEDPDQHVGGDPRLDREQLDAARSDEVMAALLPLGEDPDERRAEVALERLDLLDGGDGRDDGPQEPESDPALTDPGW